jgi:hypothetical protein
MEYEVAFLLFACFKTAVLGLLIAAAMLLIVRYSAQLL